MTHAEARTLGEQHRRDYERGMGVKEIAEAYGLKLGVVYARLHTVGVKLRPQRMPVDPAIQQRDARLLTACQSARQSAVAREFGISRQRVSQIIQRERNRA